MIDRPELCDALCHVLGNTCRIYRTTSSYGWNVSGRGAEMARICFDDQASALMKTINPIARHILGLGGKAIFDYSDRIVDVNPPTQEDIPKLPDMLTKLYEGHWQAKLSIGAAVDLAQEIDEQPTVYFLMPQIELHRLQRHRLSLLLAEY